jgi:hypothetical protein
MHRSDTNILHLLGTHTKWFCSARVGFDLATQSSWINSDRVFFGLDI